MRNQYLLSCPCGRQIPVETSQAGGEVVCACENRLEVPTLLQLTKLPRLEPEGQPAPVRKEWGTPQRFALVGVLAAVTGMGGMVYLVTWESVPPFRMSDLSPLDTWRMWHGLQAGVQYRDPVDYGREWFTQRQHRRLLGASLLAGLGAVLVAASRLWPRSRRSVLRPVLSANKVQERAGPAIAPRGRESGPGRSARSRTRPAGRDSPGPQEPA